MDDGSGGSFSSVDAETIQNKNYLRSHTVTYTASEKGLTFRFRIEAINIIGSSISTITSQQLAGVPSTPTNAPTSDSTVTGIDRIKVTWNEVADNGGSTILSYSIEMDNGEGGDFVILAGYDTDYLQLYYTVV